MLKGCLTALRQALGERGRTARFVCTLHGQGYRFVAPVTVQAPLPVDGVPHASPHSERRTPPSPRPWRDHVGAGASWPLPPVEGEEGEESEPQPPLSVGVEAPEGEHKQVTVLCGALAEASDLVASLGPEAMYHLMRGVLALVQDTVQRYGGSLLEVSGTGWVALFGAPVAHEDHTRRAVLAACELRQRLRAPDALPGQPHGVVLRLGLHTGSVVVGPLFHDPQRPYTTGGDTLAVAEWLQQQAEPDTVLLSAATYALVQAEVEGTVWAGVSRNGAAPPVAGYVVHGLRQRLGGVPRRGGRPRSPWVGWTRELALLHARLALAASGQGQVVGLAGEPGMGKSRLLAEFAHSLHGQPVTYCEGHCLAYASTTPYGPVRDVLRQLWDLPDTAPPEAMTATVQQRLHDAGLVAEEAPLLLLQLLDVPGDSAALAALDPQTQRARTFALLRQVVLHASQRQPLVLAVENLHWSDPTSEEWLTALAAGVGGTALLLLATYRPGTQVSWLAHSWATQVALTPPTPPDSLAVVQAVPGAAQLAAAQQQAIVAQAGGNPFFLEELTWAAVAQGNHTHAVPLPDTIQAVLAARMDRLPPEAKRLLQVAAVIGSEVPVGLLQRLAGLPEDAVQRGLAHLQAAEFLYETQLVPEPVYTFKHALTQEVAYSSLLQARRRALHVQSLEAIETQAGDPPDAQVARLAHHALRGEVWDKALRYSRQAGARAFARSAYREAVECWEQALEALAHLPSDRPSLEQAVDLRYDLSLALQPLTQGEQALTHLRAAEIVAKNLADHHRLGRICHRLAITLRESQNQELELTYCQQGHAIATTLGDVDLSVSFNGHMGVIYSDLGDYRRAIACLQQNLTALQGAPPDQSCDRIVRPPIWARTRMVICLSELGAFAEGVAYGDEALQMAEAGSRPYECLAVYVPVGRLHVYQGNLHQAISRLERAMALSQDADIPSYHRRAAPCLALAYALAGRAADALAVLGQMGGNTRWPSDLLACGEAYLRAGCVEEPHRLAQRVLANARERHMQGLEVRALWLLGEIALHRDPPDVVSAEIHYQQALALAEALGMRPLVAHCHLGLSTLYATTGQRESACTALAAAIALYRAMDMTFWLPQAEAALAQVA